MPTLNAIVLRRSSAVRVLVQLLEKPKTVERLAEELDMKRDNVRNGLKTLQSLGFAKITGSEEKDDGAPGSHSYLWAVTAAVTRQLHSAPGGALHTGQVAFPTVTQR